MVADPPLAIIKNNSYQAIQWRRNRVKGAWRYFAGMLVGESEARIVRRLSASISQDAAPLDIDLF